ncbi:MAG: 2OG-Fe(II) oxygenase [Geminicoccaceae bacterium]
MGLQAMPKEAPPPSWVLVRDGLFDERECLALRDLLDLEGRAEEARTKAGEDGRIRRSTIAWVPETSAWAWLDKRLAGFLAEAVRETGFVIEGFEERFQVARYEAARTGGFDWHSDRAKSGIGSRRKLSISVQLSHAAEYKGGQLEILADGRRFAAPRAMGTAVAFASFHNHRVAPVRDGVRYSLVAWSHGEDFR